VIQGIESTDSLGRDAAHINDLKGWIVKWSILYKRNSDWYFYCSKKCKEEHYNNEVLKDVSLEKKKEVQLKIDEIRNKIPEASKMISMKMAKLVDNLKNSKKIKI
jgi:hypothetical protein